MFPIMDMAEKNRFHQLGVGLFFEELGGCHVVPGAAPALAKARVGGFTVIFIFSRINISLK